MTSGPGNNDSPSILDAYFRTWVSHDLEGLAAIFHSDAEYVIVGRRTLVGLGEILAYWRRNAKVQRDVEWELLWTRSAGPLVTAVWGARFFRTDLNLWITLRGLLVLETEGGRIRRLVESYRRILTS
ncbi:limonene-1,2-epoxide hydrolase [Phycisphaerales bacterium]|nr:limonene-1,2-epoxide hydrolase [Phycisphaerales bacterium]